MDSCMQRGWEPTDDVNSTARFQLVTLYHSAEHLLLKNCHCSWSINFYTRIVTKVTFLNVKRSP